MPSVSFEVAVIFVCAGAIMIKRTELERMFPRALPEWLDALDKLAPVLGKFYDFKRLDWVHFCGQIHAETDGLSLQKMEEDMSFKTAKRILEVYSYRLGVAIDKVSSGREPEPAIAKGKTKAQLATLLIRKSKLLADIVYGGREGTPWMQGSKYLGRGPTQITHKNNYRAIGEEISRQPGGSAFDLVATPELLSTDPELGIRSAFADWHLKGLSRWAEADDCDTLSDALNTGNIRDNIKPHGLPMRRKGTETAKAVWPDAIAFDVAPAPLAIATLNPDPEPVEAKDLVGVSRKVTLLTRFKKMITWTGMGGGTAFTFADVTNNQEAIGHVGQFIRDNPLITLVTVLAVIGVVGHIMATILIRWHVEDVNEGRYTPARGVDGRV